MNTRTTLALAVAASLTCIALGSSDPHDAPLHEPPAHAAPAPAAAAETKSQALGADEAMRMLVEGNERFASNQSEQRHANQARRCETFTGGQHPFATILACADSRVPVEVLFDQGIGDLFVIRVAGNVADTDEIGTIEYGIGHLHSPLVVVLGHTKCGAVTAVVQEAKVSPNIAKLVDNIAPAVEHVKHAMPGLKGEALVQAAVDANVMQGISDLLSHSEEARHLVSSGKVNVVGAVYDLHNGTIRWLGEHPEQSALLGQPAAPAHAAGAPDSHDAHAAPEPKKDHHDAHADVPHEPTSSAAPGSALPHHSGTLKGMLLPATFLGGAGLMSGTIFYVMRNRAPAAENQAAKA